MGLLREDIGGSARASAQAVAAAWALDESVQALRYAISSVEAELTAVAGEVSVIRREMQRLDEIQRSIANLEAVSATFSELIVLAAASAEQGASVRRRAPDAFERVGRLSSEVDQQIGASLPPRPPNWGPPGSQDQRR
jgi:hypothetical protein